MTGQETFMLTPRQWSWFIAFVLTLAMAIIVMVAIAKLRCAEYVYEWCKSGLFV